MTKKSLLTQTNPSFVVNQLNKVQEILKREEDRGEIFVPYWKKLIVTQVSQEDTYHVESHPNNIEDHSQHDDHINFTHISKKCLFNLL